MARKRPAWPGTPAEAYHAVAVETGPPDVIPGFEPLLITIDDLDPAMVDAAHQHALDAHLPWPPKPVIEGWMVTTWR